MNEPAEPLDEIIGGIYDAAHNPFSWAEKLDRIRRRLDADFVCLTYMEFFDYLGSSWHAGHDDDYFRRFVGVVARSDDPFIEHYRTNPPGAVVSRKEVMDDATWQGESKYRELFGPGDMGDVLGICLLKTDDGLAMILFLKDAKAGRFTDRDKHILATLIPHLQRAMRIHERIYGLLRDRATITRAINQLASGVVIFSHTSKVVWMNETARAMIGRGDGFLLEDEELVAIRPEDSARLAAYIRSAADPRDGRGGAMAIVKSSSSTSYSALVEPLFESSEKHGDLARGAAVAFLMDPEMRPGGTRSVFRALYDLTEAEASVASEVAAGRTRAEIAKRLDISVHTVRFHLSHIFAKTGTTRQAELTRLLLRSGPGTWSS